MATRRPATTSSPWSTRPCGASLGTCCATNRADRTLQATALLNEAWLKLFSGANEHWNDRAHFFAVASRAMRSILIDSRRRRGTAKRSPDGEREPLDALVDAYEQRSGDLLRLDVALERLAKLDPDQARVVEMRFFGGRSTTEIAQAVGRSQRSIERDLTAAKAWLRRSMERDADS